MYAALMSAEGLAADSACAWPSWQTHLRAEAPHRNEEDNSALHIDHHFSHSECWGRGAVGARRQVRLGQPSLAILFTHTHTPHSTPNNQDGELDEIYLRLQAEYGSKGRRSESPNGSGPAH